MMGFYQDGYLLGMELQYVKFQEGSKWFVNEVDQAMKS